MNKWEGWQSIARYNRIPQYKLKIKTNKNLLIKGEIILRIYNNYFRRVIFNQFNINYTIENIANISLRQE